MIHCRLCPFSQQHLVFLPGKLVFVKPACKLGSSCPGQSMNKECRRHRLSDWPALYGWHVSSVKLERVSNVGKNLMCNKSADFCEQEKLSASVY
eukprot:scaffold252717_cov10-Tisochrysis_lutea.AAC.1